MNSIFWDITPLSPLKINRRFGGTCPPPSSVSSNKSRKKKKSVKQVISTALKIDATCSSETSDDFQRRYVPENETLPNHRCQNLKSYSVYCDCGTVRDGEHPLPPQGVPDPVNTVTDTTP
jgi:hypothetical protein